MSENHNSDENIDTEKILQHIKDQLKYIVKTSPDASDTEAAQNLDDKEESVTQKGLLWANWRIFIVPGRLQERERQAAEMEQGENSDQSVPQAEDNIGANDAESSAMQNSDSKDDEQDDEDKYVPKTKKGCKIGALNYIRNESWLLSIEEMLCIDLILDRKIIFAPNTPGVDRYDDWGVIQWRQSFRRFVEDFFALDIQKRKETFDEFEPLGRFSYELKNSINRLKLYIDLPKAETSLPDSVQANENERRWPAGLSGRDLELFKLLSGVDTLSPRSQALGVLDFILPDEGSTALHYTPDDKERINALLKTYPALKQRYPYLLKIIESDLPATSFDAHTNSDYMTVRSSPVPFYFPVVLAEDPKKEPTKNARLYNALAVVGKALFLIILAVFLFIFLSAIITPIK